jgi:broad specificity phosphatase PhoE
MAAFVHLVRHGEVDNPDGVVYAGLPGFPLTRTGRRQAAEAGAYLASRAVVGVWSSPLDRTMETAEEIARSHDLPVVPDGAFAEWGLSDRWAGTRWEQIPPGERAGYRTTPWDLPFSPESLDTMAYRMRSGIERVQTGLDGEVVIVSHLDPIQAARVALLSLPVGRFLEDRPSHAEVITLTPGTPWKEIGRWAPPTRSAPFPPENV